MQDCTFHAHLIPIPILSQNIRLPHKLLQKHLDLFALPVIKADLQFLYCTVTLRSWNAAVKTKFLKKTDPV